MEFIFAIVYYFLVFLSKITGLTYTEINIITYYVFIPFVYVWLIDKILKKHILKIVFGIGLLALCIIIGDLRSYAEWLFDQSVAFLEGFDKIGCNYVLASVIICVVIPGFIFCWLFSRAYPEKSKKIKKFMNKKLF